MSDPGTAFFDSILKGLLERERIANAEAIEAEKRVHEAGDRLRKERIPTPTPLIFLPDNASSTFTDFSRLPTAIRIQIWRLVLPGYIGPCFHHWEENKVYWQQRRISPSSEEVQLEFQTDLLDQVRFDLPIAFVNREARAVAMDWAQKHGCRLRRVDKGRPPMFVRDFKPERDALWVEESFWGEFLSGPDEADETSQLSIYSDITQLAVDEGTLAQFGGDMGELYIALVILPKLRVFYVVMDGSMGRRRDQLGFLADWRWEIGPLRFGSLFWNPSNQEFDFVGGEAADRLYSRESCENGRLEEEPDSLLERTKQLLMRDLVQTLVERNIDNFEIRFVHAVDCMNGPFRRHGPP